jgi:hypothetical protein
MTEPYTNNSTSNNLKPSWQQQTSLQRQAVV